MENAKIEIKIGEILFIGEGSSTWLEKQLDKILNKTDALIKLSNSINKKNDDSTTPSLKSLNNEIVSQTLIAFLKSKNAATNQTKKFLATALWLEAKGNDRIKTSEISSALKEAKQTKLGNPSDCLKNNISKGFCQKDGDAFFVTEEGRNSFGL